MSPGGLTAVMWTDTIQGVILIGGSFVLTFMSKSQINDFICEKELNIFVYKYIYLMCLLVLFQSS